MAKITIADVTATANITIGDTSSLSGAGLKDLSSTTAKFVNELQQDIKNVDFQSASMGAVFTSPKITLDSKRSLTVKAGTNCTLTRYTVKDKEVLGTDPTVPKVDIGTNDYWLSFALQSTLEVGGTGSVGSGFGVSVKLGSAITLSSYSLFSATTETPTTLEQAIESVLGGFDFVLTAKRVRDMHPGTIKSSDVSGSVTVSGTYSWPIAVNQLVLAEALVPFKVKINPSLGVKLGGSVAVTGDYCAVCWRSSLNEIQLALLKKKGTTLTATFTAGAGLAANADGTDLISAFFSAVAPGVDLTKAGLTKADPRYKAINDVLTDCISQAFTVSVNTSCAATFSDQAAVVYSIDLSNDADAAKMKATDAAIDAALNGDWSLVATLPNAKELRNVIGNNKENKLTLSVNLLGLFDYETVEDFVKSSTIVHDVQNTSVTITDTATAKRITVATSPYLADSEKLRRVLYESTVATAAYALVNGKSAAAFNIQQSMLIYKARMSSSDLRKALRLALLIDEMTPAQLSALQMANPSHVLIDARQSLGTDQIMKMFFADPVSGTPHTLDALKSLGRETLAALLDPSNPEDAVRIQVLNDDATWQGIDTNGGKPPANSPASYSDWYDITFWANAIHDAAGPLKAAIVALQNVPAGTDPSKDANFTQARDKLKKTIGEVTHDTHAAFEMGWPIAVTNALVDGNTDAKVTAIWNGVPQLPVPQPAFATSPAIAKTVATRAGAS